MKRILIALLVCSTLVLYGCGGKPGAGATPTPSDSAIITQTPTPHPIHGKWKLGDIAEYEFHSDGTVSIISEAGILDLSYTITDTTLSIDMGEEEGVTVSEYKIEGEELTLTSESGDVTKFTRVSDWDNTTY